MNSYDWLAFCEMGYIPYITSKWFPCMVLNHIWNIYCKQELCYILYDQENLQGGICLKCPSKHFEMILNVCIWHIYFDISILPKCWLDPMSFVFYMETRQDTSAMESINIYDIQCVKHVHCFNNAIPSRLHFGWIYTYKNNMFYLMHQVIRRIGLVYRLRTLP